MVSKHFTFFFVLSITNNFEFVEIKEYRVDCLSDWTIKINAGW